MAAYVAIALIAYLIGSVNFSIIITKKMAGFDVREKGSKNAGTTNVLRTVGKKAALFTLILDILKGVVVILITKYLMSWWGDESNIIVSQYLAGFFVVVGHTFPAFFQFKGGKGVATCLGVLLTLDWKIGLVCLIFAIILIIITKMVSVGSLLVAILFPILTIVMNQDISVEIGIISILISALVIFNHRTNIKRIKDGTENKIKFKK